MVGVEHGVVVAVDDLLPRAVAELLGVAGRRETTECRGIALVVGGAMVAEHGAARRRGPCHRGLICASSPDSRISSKQRLPLHSAGSVASATDSYGRPSQTSLQPDWLSRQSVRDAGALQHVQQRLVAADLLFVVVVAPHGENRQGTETSVLVPQELASGKLITSAMAASSRRGLARIAVHAPVLRARGFAEDEDQQPRFGCRPPAGAVSHPRRSGSAPA